MTLKCLGAIAALLIFVIVIYVVLNDRIVNDPLWSEKILTKCSNVNMNEAFLSAGMLDYFYISLGFGSYLGLIYNAKMCPDLLLSETTRNEKWYAIMPLLRLLIGVAICVVFCLINHWIWSAIVTNIYLAGLFKTFLPWFACSMILFGINDHICIKLNLIKEDKDDSEDDEHLSDNSFEDKARFEQSDDDFFGVRSNSKLHDMRGANFSREKKKIKDRETDTQENFAINSVQY